LETALFKLAAGGIVNAYTLQFIWLLLRAHSLIVLLCCLLCGFQTHFIFIRSIAKHGKMLTVRCISGVWSMFWPEHVHDVRRFGGVVPVVSEEIRT
jgi:hypothetical protein